jgi:hypothetical protein
MYSFAFKANEESESGIKIRNQSEFKLLSEEEEEEEAAKAAEEEIKNDFNDDCDCTEEERQRAGRKS